MLDGKILVVNRDILNAGNMERVNQKVMVILVTEWQITKILIRQSVPFQSVQLEKSELSYWKLVGQVIARNKELENLLNDNWNLDNVEVEKSHIAVYRKKNSNSLTYSHLG